MSQEQPRRAELKQAQGEPIKYGDVFIVPGELAREPIAPQDLGVAVTEANLPGRRIVTEAVGGQVVGKHEEPVPVGTGTMPVTVPQGDAITIGEALETTAMAAGEKPVEKSDAAAIQAAEVRATRTKKLLPGGVSAQAQSAAAANTRAMPDEDKVKLRDVLGEATTRLPADKAATGEDADRVGVAEMRNNPDIAMHREGVGANVAEAARLNRDGRF